MPSHDKPVSNYPYRNKQPEGIIDWIKEDAYASIGDTEKADYWKQVGDVHRHLLGVVKRHRENGLL
jgi:hypothetical protein